MSSLATRLSVTFALFAAAMALVIGVLVYEQTADARVKRARTEALDRLDVATTYYELEARQLFGGVSDDPAGIHAPRSLARAVRTGSRGSLLADGAMWAGRPASGATSGLYLRVPYARSASELRDLRRTIMLTGLIATLVAAFLGVAVARGLARSLRRTAHTAEQMASGDLGARVEVRGKDEVAAVGAVVNRMAAAMSERIERERRFSADVAHELRTPLTGLVAASAVLPPSRPAELVQDRVRAFRRLVDQLLEISRIDGRAEPIAREPVDLGRLARAVCSARPGVIVHDACAGTLEVDARRLERVIVNLLDNAERHGRPPIEVVVEEASITVRDHGPGFPPAFLERATERFAVADPARSDGAGLGLSIVVEHVRLLEGELAIARHPDGGAIVTVSLPSGKSTVTEAT